MFWCFLKSRYTNRKETNLRPSAGLCPGHVEVRTQEGGAEHEETEHLQTWGQARSARLRSPVPTLDGRIQTLESCMPARDPPPCTPAGVRQPPRRVDHTGKVGGRPAPPRQHSERKGVNRDRPGLLGVPRQGGPAQNGDPQHRSLRCHTEAEAQSTRPGAARTDEAWSLHTGEGCTRHWETPPGAHRVPGGTAAQRPRPKLRLHRGVLRPGLGGQGPSGGRASPTQSGFGVGAFSKLDRPG